MPTCKNEMVKKDKQDTIMIVMTMIAITTMAPTITIAVKMIMIMMTIMRMKMIAIMMITIPTSLKKKCFHYCTCCFIKELKERK